MGLHCTPGQFVDAIVGHVAQLCAEARQNAVVAIGLHFFLVGQPGRIGALRSCLEQIAAMPQAWLASGAEIADRVVAHGSRGFPPPVTAPGPG